MSRLEQLSPFWKGVVSAFFPDLVHPKPRPMSDSEATEFDRRALCQDWQSVCNNKTISSETRNKTRSASRYGLL